MKRGRKERSIELPSFAKLIPPRRRNRLKKPLSLEDEEEYLRTRSFYCLARQIDFAVEDTFAELSRPFDEALDCMLQNHLKSEEQYTEPTDCLDSSPEKRLDVFVIDEPCRQAFSRELLPVLALHAPPYFLDRQDWMRHLVQANKTKRPTCCTVWLRSTSALNASWQEELRRQCFVQEPDLPTSLQNVDKKPITETLVEWAKETCHFDEIVVFLDIDCDFSSSRVQDFIHWMTELRSIQELPFNLVLLVPHGVGRHLEIRSTAQGNGIRMNHIHLPSSVTFLEKFCKNIYVRQAFPIIFPARAVRGLQDTFEEQNKSCIHIIQKLKAILAHVFSNYWSFLLAEQACVSDDRTRIRWFLNSPKGRALLPIEIKQDKQSLQKWLFELKNHRQLGCIAMQLNSLLRENVTKQSSPLLFLLGRDQYNGLDMLFHEIEKKRALEFLVQHRRRLASPPSDASVNDTTSPQISDSLNELIILCAASMSHLDIIRNLLGLQEQWSDHISAFVSSEKFSAWTQTQPRSQFLRGFVQGPRCTKELNLAATAAHMYALIENQVSISRHEWFGLFHNTVAAGVSEQDALAFFGYGFYHLKLCGLLKARASTLKAEVRYEKAMVIWCR